MTERVSEMNLAVIGISHHTAPVAVREALALGGQHARPLLREMRDDDVFEEALVIDTCNRTEIYFVGKDGERAIDRLLGHIARVKGVEKIQDTSVFYRHDGQEAARHLFRVAAALDSQIVGEHQISGQVKDAYRQACEERTARFFMHKLIHCAFRVGKRAQSETDIGIGSASVAQAAVDLSQQVFSSLAGKSAMLVGAGQTGALAAKALVRGGVSEVIVANRSIARAESVAADILKMLPEDVEELDIPVDKTKRRSAMSAQSPSQAQSRSATRAIGLDGIPGAIGDVDLVISATGAPGLVLQAAELAPAIKKSRRSLFIVDIAVPRDVDPQLGRLSNVFLYNMDDLDRIVAKNIASRRREIPRVEAIIADELDALVKWSESLQVIPTIKLLQRRFDLTRQAEIDKYGKKFVAADREQLDQFTQGMCKKVLHRPIAFLRTLTEDADSSDCLAAVDLVRKMFHLDNLEQDE